MTEKKAFKILAQEIKSRGEIKDGQGCLVPEQYSNSTKASEFNEASAILHEKYRATHYNIIWCKALFGYKVKIELIENEAFGASAQPHKLVCTQIVRI
jgi:hypothetical protein